MKRHCLGKVLMSVLGVLLIAAVVVGPQAAWAKSKTVRFVAAGSAEGVQEVSAEQMALNMYLGALDYRMRTFHVLKGKYNLKMVHTLFSSPNDCLTGVASGAGEMTFSGPHYLEQLEPAWKLGEAPGVFDNYAHFLKTMNTPAWKELQAKMAKEKGVTIVKWMLNVGDFWLFSNKGPIKSMADLKGQKIRFPGGEGFSKALGAMGATGISLPYTEVVTGLQTHMIDGLLTEMFAAVFFYDLPRYTKYCVPVTWAVQPVCIVVGTKWWESLPKKERKAMQDVFDRVDVHEYFDNAQAGITAGWQANPATELVTLDGAEVKKWKETMRQSTADLVKGIDPKLVEAIESAR